MADLADLAHGASTTCADRGRREWQMLSGGVFAGRFVAGIMAAGGEPNNEDPVAARIEWATDDTRTRIVHRAVLGRLRRGRAGA
jgi:hypothetical protein